jgi:dehydrogenase/reductase SDR family protein 1
VVATAGGGAFDLSNSESPEFIGRVIASLHGGADPMSVTGRALVAAEIASQRGILDIDRRSPRLLTLSNV